MSHLGQALSLEIFSRFLEPHDKPDHITQSMFFYSFFFLHFAQLSYPSRLWVFFFNPILNNLLILEQF